MEDTRQRDTLQEGLLSGGKQERWDGCMTGGTQVRRDAGKVGWMHDRRNTGQKGCRKGGMDA